MTKQRVLGNSGRLLWAKNFGVAMLHSKTCRNGKGGYSNFFWLMNHNWPLSPDEFLEQGQNES